MFDEGSFVLFCQDAIDQPDAPFIIQAELRRIVARPAEITLPPSSDRQSWRLHRSPRLTVLIPPTHLRFAPFPILMALGQSSRFTRAGRTALFLCATDATFLWHNVSLLTLVTWSCSNPKRFMIFQRQQMR